jgi:hypothetical protein
VDGEIRGVLILRDDHVAWRPLYERS